jgi:hypothetical protein
MFNILFGKITANGSGLGDGGAKEAQTSILHKC